MRQEIARRGCFVVAKEIIGLVSMTSPWCIRPGISNRRKSLALEGTKGLTPWMARAVVSQSAARSADKWSHGPVLGDLVRALTGWV